MNVQAELNSIIAAFHDFERHNQYRSPAILMLKHQQYILLSMNTNHLNQTHIGVLSQLLDVDVMDMSDDFACVNGVKYFFTF